MSMRFKIRKFSDTDFHRWALMDGACPYVSCHDFPAGDLASCEGACDTFRHFSSAIGTIRETLAMERTA